MINIEKLIHLQVVIFLTISFEVSGAYYFNPDLIDNKHFQKNKVDLSLFEEKKQLPGTYRVDLYINNEKKDTRNVEFHLVNDEKGVSILKPCLSTLMLKEMGVKVELYPKINNLDDICANLSAIPHASTNFIFNKQKLIISIPQIAISNIDNDYMYENQLDEGISALLLDYSVVGSNYYSNNINNSNSQYINVRPGVNFGVWRFRNYSIYSNGDNGGFKSLYTYLQRNLIKLKSQLVFGDNNSSTDLFNSVSYRGIQISSDDSMLPDRLKGYSPDVSGIARTNAEITIRQNGYIIYRSFVPPGPFKINDIYPTGSLGNLYVSVKESDGSEQLFIVPFASLPILQREGNLKYSFTGGKYRSYNHNGSEPVFGQATLIYGISGYTTLYTGLQYANNYNAFLFGVGENLGNIGAISLDLTLANSTLESEKNEKGHVWRLRYSKSIPQTETNVSLAALYYSKDGYYDFQEVQDTYSKNNYFTKLSEQKRDRTEMTISQNLYNDSGTLSLNFINENYWDNNRNMRSIGVNYSNYWYDINYGVDYSYNKNTVIYRNRSTNIEQFISFNVTFPFPKMSNNIYVNYNLSTSKNGTTTQNIGINGTALPNRNLSWSFQQSYENENKQKFTNINTNYRGSYNEVNLGYSYNSNSQNLNYGVSGGIILHNDGITFGNTLGETAALIKIAGASGVEISNRVGIKTDWRGYAIVPNVNPYRKNKIQINPSTLPKNVDLTLASKSVTPTRGAIVQATFDTSIGQRALFTLILSDGSAVPFGAIVSYKRNNQHDGFIVGDNGKVYLSGISDKGYLDVRWGNNKSDRCSVDYELLDLDKNISTGTYVCK